MSCRWWGMKERHEVSSILEEECHRRAPHAGAGARFPLMRGEDGCGDYQPAGPEVYREDYRGKLGPWIHISKIFEGHSI